MKNNIYSNCSSKNSINFVNNIILYPINMNFLIDIITISHIK